MQQHITHCFFGHDWFCDYENWTFLTMERMLFKKFATMDWHLAKFEEFPHK